MGNTISKATDQFIHRFLTCGAKKKKSSKSGQCSDKSLLEEPVTYKNVSANVCKHDSNNEDHTENTVVCEDNGRSSLSSNQQNGNTALSSHGQSSPDHTDKYSTAGNNYESKPPNMTSDSKQDLLSSENKNLSCIISSEKSSKLNSRVSYKASGVDNHRYLLKTAEDMFQTDPISELENQQAAIFARLKRIQNELDKMSHSTKCGESGQTAAPLLDNIKFQDLVIGVDPESLPFSVLILYQELSRCLKVKPTVYVHSSIEKKPSSQLCNIFDLAAPLKKPEDRRLSNDLLLSIIYKQVRQGCSLMVNPEKQTYIYGEVNIARYFSRLMNPSYDKDPVQSTQIDAWVDKASLLLYNGNAEQNKEMLKDLDSTLAKRKWLVGQDLSLADIVSWSGIQRNKLTKLVSSNVEVWMKTCASHPMFSFVNKVLSHL